jgi:cytochrome c
MPLVFSTMSLGENMNSVLIGTLVAAGLVVASAASAADANMELAQKSGCLACHTADKKVVGPSYKEIAAKYKGDKGAEAKLAQKVLKGGGGVWGAIPMPPNNIPEAQAQQLVKWILAM